MFKDGEKIICVDENTIKIQHGNTINFINYGLTLGKKYEAIHSIFPKEGYVHIRNDRGETQDYRNSFFVSLPQYRKLKLEKICSKLEI